MTTFHKHFILRPHVVNSDEHPVIIYEVWAGDGPPVIADTGYEMVYSHTDISIATRWMLDADQLMRSLDQPQPAGTDHG